MWQWLIAIGLLALTGCCGAIPLGMARRARRYCLQFISPSSPASGWPKVLLVLPCKGQVEELPHLKENLEPVLKQDYPSYRVVFAVSDPQDLAIDVLRKLCAQYRIASVVVSQRHDRCSEKVGNQLRAIEEAHDDEEVFVFIDSDARPAPTLLQDLVAPLCDAAVGATTGFRWYTPSKSGAGFGSWLRAAWNAGGLPFLTDPRHNYAWGGAMAIRRAVFEQCKIADYWSKALSDDLGLSLVVKQAGHRIVLVPNCLVRSREDLSLRQTIEWTSRQTVICRVYNHAMWRDIFIGELITFMAFLLSAMTLVGGVMTRQWQLMGTAAVGAMMILMGRFLYQLIVLETARAMAPDLVSRPLIRKLVQLAPLVHVLILYNSFRSLLSRKIVWRGVRYDLRGPQEILVLDRT